MKKGLGLVVVVVALVLNGICGGFNVGKADIDGSDHGIPDDVLHMFHWRMVVSAPKMVWDASSGTYIFTQACVCYQGGNQYCTCLD